MHQISESYVRNSPQRAVSGAEVHSCTLNNAAVDTLHISTPEIESDFSAEMNGGTASGSGRSVLSWTAELDEVLMVSFT